MNKVSPKTEETPKNENMIIAIGSMKTVFTFTTRFLLWIKPKTSKVKKTAKTHVGVWLINSDNGYILLIRITIMETSQ